MDTYCGSTLVFGVAELSGGILMVEVSGYVGVTADLMQPISIGRQIVSHFCNVNGADRSSWWRDGTPVLTFEPLFPDEREGDTPDVLVDTMRDVGFAVDARDDDERHQTEAAFAPAERVTGSAGIPGISRRSTFRRFVVRG